MKKRTVLLLSVLSLLLLGWALSAQTTPGLRVQGRFLYDHLGEKVILVGVNKMIYWTDTDGIPSFPEIAKTGANCVRVQWLTDGTPEQLDKAVYNCRVNKMYPMVELHDATGDWSKLTALVDYWVRPDIVTILKKHEQYLMVNIGNEVGQTVSDADYRTGYETAVRRMRTAGIHVPLVIDAAGYGQNINGLQANGPYLISIDPDKNLLFSIHMWWPYMWGHTDQEVVDEIAESVNMNLPLIVGEFGNKWDESSTGGIPYVTIITECNKNQVGWLPWEWGPGNNPQTWLDMTTDSTYATLRDWGLEVAVSAAYSIKNVAKKPSSLVNLTPVPTPTPTPVPSDMVSYKKPVTASSQESNEYLPSYAVDGSLDTRWASTASEPNDIYVDLGTSYNIYKVVLRWETAYAREYKIQISNDKNTWTDLYHEYNSDGGADTITVSASGRYVRMLGLYRQNTQWGMSLWEFEVYGSTGQITPTPTASRTPTPTGLLGDVNGDGSVTIVDALMVAQYAAGLNPSGINLARADVNRDGAATIVDALQIARYAAGLITQF